MIDDIVKEATEAEEQGRDAGYAVGELLRIINQQKAEIRELKRKLIDEQKEIGKIAMKYFAREEEIERQKLEIEILIRKKEALRDEIAEKDAEIDRQDVQIMNLKHEIEDWKSEYERACAERDARIVTQRFAKSEAYREFVDKVKKISKEVTVPYVADTSIQEHKTGVFWYIAEDFDNLVKELTESNE